MKPMELVLTKEWLDRFVTSLRNTAKNDRRKKTRERQRADAVDNMLRAELFQDAKRLIDSYDETAV